MMHVESHIPRGHEGVLPQKVYMYMLWGAKNAENLNAEN